jgi:Peptidase A4 family
MRSSRVVVAGVAVGVALAAGVGLSAGTSAAAAGSHPSVQVGLLRLAHHHAFNITQSNNWSGYNQGVLEKGKTFNQVAGTWVVPTASPHKSGQAEYSATWVGIGGGCLNTSCTIGDNTLIQAGTEQDVAASGKRGYYAWYELIPAASQRVSLAVAPGNKVTVNIKQTSPGQWSIVIRNATTGKSWSKSTAYPSTMATAEWIEETPLLIGGGTSGIAALPKLSTVHITGATANGVAAGLASAERMQLVDGSGHVLATPSNPNKAKTAFNDCTYATFCAVPAG